MIKINIEEGDILVNSAWVSFETPSLIIIELDTKSKYPQVACYGEDQISLYADDHTHYTKVIQIDKQMQKLIYQKISVFKQQDQVVIQLRFIV